MAVAHFVDGANRSEIARMLKVTRRSVNTWVENYLSLGIEGLNTKKQKGRTCYLSSTQQSELLTYIDKQSKSDTGGRLTGESIHQYITLHFGITYHPNAIYKLLCHLGFSWITRRAKHPKQSQDGQDEFKKTTN
ncbi:MAG: transposase [Paraglaciecola sp.]